MPSELPPPVTPVTIAVDRVITEGDKLDLGRGCVLQFSLVKAGRKSARDCSGGSTGEEWPTIRWVTSWFVLIYWCAGPWRMWESENGSERRGQAGNACFCKGG